MDIFSQQKRSEIMRAVKSTGTKEEVRLGKAMWYLGLRYRKNNRKVFGKPDFTFKKYKIAIFVDSEFFHGKDWEITKPPIKSNQTFWYDKIQRNINRDKEVNAHLQSQGWTVIRFWSRDIKKNLDTCVAVVQEAITKAASSS